MSEAFRNEVRETVSPYKFGNDRRAAAAWLIALDGGLDDETGTTDAVTGWVGRIGRTIIGEDSLGFVYCERFPSELKAIQRFDAIEREYGTSQEGESC